MGGATDAESLAALLEQLVGTISPSDFVHGGSMYLDVEEKLRRAGLAADALIGLQLQHVQGLRGYENTVWNTTGPQVASLFERELQPGIYQLAQAKSFPARARLFSHLDDTIATHYGQIATTTDDLLRPLVNAEYAYARKQMETVSNITGMAVKLDAGRMPKEIADRIMAAPVQGLALKEWWQGQSAATSQRFKAAVQLGLVKGESFDAIVARVMGANGRGGVQGSSLASAQRLTRTMITQISNEATLAGLKEVDPNVSDSYEYIATLDDRTTEICRALDGKVFQNDDPLAPRPPQHWGCRSKIGPVVNWDWLGVDADKLPPTLRASAGGPTAERTYAEWLNTQTPEMQDAILGKAKGMLWRDGKVTLDDLVNNDGSAVTLDELAQRLGLDVPVARSMPATPIPVTAPTPMGVEALPGESIPQDSPAALLWKGDRTKYREMDSWVKAAREFVSDVISKTPGNRVTGQRFHTQDPLAWGEFEYTSGTLSMNEGVARELADSLVTGNEAEAIGPLQVLVHELNHSISPEQGEIWRLRRGPSGSAYGREMVAASNTLEEGLCEYRALREVNGAFGNPLYQTPTHYETYRDEVTFIRWLEEMSPGMPEQLWALDGKDRLIALSKFTHSYFDDLMMQAGFSSEEMTLARQRVQVRWDAAIDNGYIEGPKSKVFREGFDPLLNVLPTNSEYLRSNPSKENLAKWLRMYLEIPEPPAASYALKPGLSKGAAMAAASKVGEKLPQPSPAVTMFLKGTHADNVDDFVAAVLKEYRKNMGSKARDIELWVTKARMGGAWGQYSPSMQRIEISEATSKALEDGLREHDKTKVWRGLDTITHELEHSRSGDHGSLLAMTRRNPVYESSEVVEANRALEEGLCEYRTLRMVNPALQLPTYSQPPKWAAYRDEVAFIRWAESVSPGTTEKWFAMKGEERILSLIKFTDDYLSKVLREAGFTPKEIRAMFARLENARDLDIADAIEGTQQTVDFPEAFDERVMLLLNNHDFFNHHPSKAAIRRWAKSWLKFTID